MAKREDAALKFVSTVFRCTDIPILQKSTGFHGIWSPLKDNLLESFHELKAFREKVFAQLWWLRNWRQLEWNVMLGYLLLWHQMRVKAELCFWKPPWKVETLILDCWVVGYYSCIQNRSILASVGWGDSINSYYCNIAQLPSFFFNFERVNI